MRGESTRRVLAAVAIAMAAACSRSRPSVPILTYHSVSEAADGFTVAPQSFAGQLDALRQAGFQTITFREWLAHEDKGAALPPHPIILTFDDGYEDAYSTVLPALRSRGMRACFFINTAVVAADAARREARPEDGTTRRYLVWPEVRALADAGMELGSHGATHARLPDLDRSGVVAELRSSKERLETGIGRPIDVFAYPYNSVRRWIEPLVREEGYRAAVAGVAHGSADRFALYRTGVYRDTTPDALLGILRADARR
jgi:peptidoglycan/xylan/chitin deacetylase (PgdA/CDA1 family)